MAEVSEPEHSSNACNSVQHIVAAAFTCVALLSSCTTRIQTDAGGRVIATVTSVIDGDTLVVSVGGRREEIRLIGIDTPETVHPTKPVQCWGPEASAYARSLLPRGTRVVLTRDIEPRDRFGRLLAYVRRESDQLFVNLDMVANGFARPYPFEPNTALQAQFAEASYTAQTRRLGLWSNCQG